MLNVYCVKIVNDDLEYTVSEDAVIQLFGNQISLHLLRMDDVEELTIHSERDGDINIRKVGM